MQVSLWSYLAFTQRQGVASFYNQALPFFVTSKYILNVFKMINVRFTFHDISF
jgi:hypothetical protein